MRIQYRVISPQKPSWLARIFLSLAAISLAVLGFFFITAALIAGALIALVVGVRLWWALRKFKREHGEAYSRAQTQNGGATGGTNAPLDGEYQVVERDSRPERLPDTTPPNNTPPER